mmetsp:Transcript_48018/g.159122  ORF Transcript_48018/g.159122 Transcript_48018/m.159122 type:complete len:377 (+) Transcript_48018:99-1229(+)
MPRIVFLALLYLPGAAPLPSESYSDSSEPALATHRMSPLFASATPPFVLAAAELGLEGRKDMTDVMGETPKDFETDYKDATKGAFGFGTGVWEAVNNPNAANAAKIVGSIGTIGAATVPPPAGVVIGTAVTLFSSLVGGGSASGPSNNDVIAAVNDGFRKMSKRFDDLESRVDRIDRTLADVKTGIAQLKIIGSSTLQLAEGINININWEGPLKNINSRFNELVDTYLKLALTKPTAFRWNAFYDKAKTDHEELGKEQYDGGIFDKEEVKKYLEAVYHSTANNAGRCGQVVAYQSVLAARFQLFFISAMGRSYQHHCSNTTDRCDTTKLCGEKTCEQNCCWLPDGAYVEHIANKTYKQIEEYDTLLGELQIKDIVL